jgi:TRAP-type C4-dicarboxylate transport system permease small subunit
VDVFIKNLPPRWRWANDIFIMGILLVMTVIIMAGGFWVCWDSWMTQKKTANEFPEYFLSLAIPVGLVFLAYEVAVSLWRKIASPGSESDRTPASH